jgi:hypothetical protein
MKGEKLAQSVKTVFQLTIPFSLRWVFAMSVVFNLLSPSDRPEVFGEYNAYPRENILTALHARPSALPATALRGRCHARARAHCWPADPTRCRAGGARGHAVAVAISLVAPGRDRSGRAGCLTSSAFDALCVGIGFAIAADGMLDSRCDWVEVKAHGRQNGAPLNAPAPGSFPTTS